jgi:LacI family transcriptional regulator
MLSLANPPDAIFVANNRMLVGALRACREAAVDIPNQVSLVGFDDLPWADLTTPSITTLRQPTYEIGSAAARLLIERLQGDRSPGREIVFQPELVVRESSIKKADARFKS